MIQTLLGLKWKLGLGAATIALVVAGVFLFQAQMENRHLLKQNAQLDARINNKVTGYVAQLAQATTNVAQLKSALDSQNEALRTQAAESGQKLSELEATVARVQRENQKLRADSAAIMKTPPAGDNLIERIEDIDARLLETLK